MTNAPSDERVREAFQRLRSDTEATGAPDFRAMLDRARQDAAAAPAVPLARRIPRRRVVWAGGIASAAVAATIAAVLLTRGDSDTSADAEFERLVASYASEAGAWRSPTDALLDVPGSGLTRALPSVGAGLEDAR